MQKKLLWFLWAVSHGIETTAGKSIEDGMVWMNWMTGSSLLILLPFFCYNRRQLEMLSISKVSEATQNSDLLCSKCFQLRRRNNSGFSRNYDCFAPWPDNRLVISLLSKSGGCWSWDPPRCSFMDGSLVKKDWLNVWRFRETTFSLFCCIVVFQNSLVCLAHQCLCQAFRQIQTWLRRKIIVIVMILQVIQDRTMHRCVSFPYNTINHQPYYEFKSRWRAFNAASLDHVQQPLIHVQLIHCDHVWRNGRTHFLQGRSESMYPWVAKQVPWVFMNSPTGSSAAFSLTMAALF